MVVDPELLVQVWNPKAENLWGLRADEVRGKNLLNLDIGLPVERLKPALRACLAGEAAYQEIVLEATNRRGKPILCRVTCTPMTDGDGDQRRHPGHGRQYSAGRRRDDRYGGAIDGRRATGGGRMTFLPSSPDPDEPARAAIRLRVRRERAIPVLESFKAWLDAQEPDVLPKSPLVAAQALRIALIPGFIRQPEAAFVQSSLS